MISHWIRNYYLWFGQFYIRYLLSFLGICILAGAIWYKYTFHAQNNMVRLSIYIPFNLPKNPLLGRNLSTTVAPFFVLRNRWIGWHRIGHFFGNHSGRLSGFHGWLKDIQVMGMLMNYPTVFMYQKKLVRKINPLWSGLRFRSDIDLIRIQTLGTNRIRIQPLRTNRIRIQTPLSWKFSIYFMMSFNKKLLPFSFFDGP